MKKRIVLFTIIIALCAISITAAFTVFSSGSRYSRNIDKATKYYNEGQYKEAILSFDKAIKISDKDAEVWMAKANAQLQIGDNQGVLQTTVDFYNNQSDYYNNLDIDQMRIITEQCMKNCNNQILYNALEKAILENGWQTEIPVASSRLKTVIDRIHQNYDVIEYAASYVEGKVENNDEKFGGYKEININQDLWMELICWWVSEDQNSVFITIYQFNGTDYQPVISKKIVAGDPMTNSGGVYLIQKDDGIQILVWNMHGTIYRTFYIYELKGDTGNDNNKKIEQNTISSSDLSVTDGYSYTERGGANLSDTFLYRFNSNSGEFDIPENSSGDDNETLSEKYEKYLTTAIGNGIALETGSPAEKRLQEWR